MTSGDKEISKKASMDGVVKGCLESLRKVQGAQLYLVRITHVLILSVKETLARSRALRTKRRTSSNSSGPTGGPPFCTTRQQQESASKDLSPQI